MKTLKKLFEFSLGPVLGAIFSAVSVPIATHYLLPNEYGKTSMFNLMYTVLLILAYLGMFLPSNGLKYGLKWPRISNLDQPTFAVLLCLKSLIFQKNLV